MCLDSFFPFENEAQRKSLYFENKEYLTERTKDARRIEDHFFYKEDREMPQAFFDYEDERGIKKYARKYLITDSSRESGWRFPDNVARNILQSGLKSLPKP